MPKWLRRWARLLLLTPRTTLSYIYLMLGMCALNNVAGHVHAAWYADRFYCVAVLQTKEQSFARRDLLLKIQEDAQKKWESEKVFNAEPPAPGVNMLSSRTHLRQCIMLGQFSPSISVDRAGLRSRPHENLCSC